MRLARVLGAIGRVCIAAGLLILLFVAYQLWGTGIREAQAQNGLEDEFEQAIAEVDASPSPGGTAAPATTLPPPPPPNDGEATARMRIPKIGVDKIVVEGVSLDDLKRGPGHYSDTPLPGQPGNAAIAGHRTTYGAPFNRLNELDPGDEILVTTLQGSFRYEVTEQVIVSPGEVDVLDDKGDNRITLTACHPKYSARQRIIVVGRLAGDAAPAPPPPAGGGSGAGPDESAGRRTIDAGLDGERASATPTILLAVSCALIWMAAWLGGRLVNRWVAYAVATPVFLVVLFFFFENVSRLLPANF